MTDAPDHHEEELFTTASEIEDSQARADYLDRSCAGNPALRERIERLLRAQARADRYLSKDGQLPDASLLEAESDAKIAEEPGTVIGRYKLLEQIGEGGFGVVYMAEQEEPVRRRVALKIIKPGMDTHQVVARFEAERQALAMMDHPNIAKVLEAGATETGRPYFVMDLVKGIPITEFCDRSNLSVEERLKLFLPVCQAIQHAHQKGVIHRDLKPSNILVTLDYGESRPKVIDFGIAKALNQRLTEKTLYTRFAQMIGTPAYMSPEQAEMSSLDIDTRTDVYSLGVVLYELLTGSTPLSEERLRALGFAAIQQAISQEEAEKPSTRVSTLGGELAAIAQRRGAEATALGRLLRGDLDWIVLKAIEKDRRRRYDTPGDLAADLRRYLDSEPVVATPPSALYRLRKFARRNKALVTAGVAIAATLLVTAGFSTWQAIRATRSESRAVTAEALARQEADTAQDTLEFLQDDLLSVADPFSGDPDRPRGRNLTLLKAVDLASRRVGERFESRPFVEAGIRQTLWRIYFTLGEHDQAEAHLARALDLYEGEVGSQDLRLLKARESQAWSLRARGKNTEATELIESVIAELAQVVEPGHVQLLEARRCLLAILSRSHRIPEAIALGEELITQARLLPAEHTDILLGLMHDLSWACYQQGSQSRQQQLSEEGLALARERLGNDHPRTIELMSNWGTWLREQLQRPLEAEALQQEAYSRACRILGEQHDTAIGSASELSVLDVGKGLFGRSLALQTNLVVVSAQALGRDDRRAVFEQMRLAWSRHDEGRDEDAVALLTDALKRLRETQGDDGFLTRRAMRWLSGVRIAQGRYADALALRREVVDLCRRPQVLGPNSRWTHFQTLQLANLHARLGHWPEAAELCRTFLPNYVPGTSESEVNNRHRDRPLAAGFVLARLAEDEPGARELAELALKWVKQTQRRETRYGIALALLLDPQFIADREALLALAERAGAECPDARRKTLLLGIAALRRGVHREAAEKLSDLAGRAATAEAGLAGACAALAWHQLGEPDLAAKNLQRARNLLEQLARSGDLGYSTFDLREEWLPTAELILACHEADVAIHGRRVSELLDGNPSGFGHNWQDAVIFQILLREARQRITPATPAGNLPSASE